MAETVGCPKADVSSGRRRVSLCVNAGNRFAGSARSGGTPRPADVAKSTRRESIRGSYSGRVRIERWSHLGTCDISLHRICIYICVFINTLDSHTLVIVTLRSKGTIGTHSRSSRHVTRHDYATATRCGIHLMAVETRAPRSTSKPPTYCHRYKP